MSLLKLTIALLVLACAIGAQGSSDVHYYSVDWSPDGGSLVYTVIRNIGEKERKVRGEVYTVRTDGSDVRRITNEEVNGYLSSWGNGRIVFSGGPRETSDLNVYAVNADGSNLAQLTPARLGLNTSPAITRDGRRIAFISDRVAGKYQIYVMNADGSGSTRVTKDDSIEHFNPAFSPDGGKIVYRIEKEFGKSQIWVMNADGSNQTLLTGNVAHNINPAFSPDGKRIIFSSWGREPGVDATFIYVMNADGSDLKKIKSVPAHYARFSPDGKKIAYAAGRHRGDAAIYIANADGSGAVRVTK